MDQQRVEEKNEKEEQSEESESVTDRSEEEMSDMTIAFEWDKESAKNDDAKTYDPYFGMTRETEFSTNLPRHSTPKTVQGIAAHITPYSITPKSTCHSWRDGTRRAK